MNYSKGDVILLPYPFTDLNKVNGSLRVWLEL